MSDAEVKTHEKGNDVVNVNFKHKPVTVCFSQCDCIFPVISQMLHKKHNELINNHLVVFSRRKTLAGPLPESPW